MRKAVQPPIELGDEVKLLGALDESGQRFDSITGAGGVVKGLTVFFDQGHPEPMARIEFFDVRVEPQWVRRSRVVRLHETKLQARVRRTRAALIRLVAAPR